MTLGYMSSGIIGSGRRSILIFPRNLHTPTAVDECYPYFTSLAPGAVTCVIDPNHSDRCEMKSQSRFVFHFPDE